LDNKIQGGIRAGIKTFLYPKANSKDFQEILNIGSCTPASLKPLALK
jgi:hypothetical protein